MSQSRHLLPSSGFADLQNEMPKSGWLPILVFTNLEQAGLIANITLVLCMGDKCPVFPEDEAP
jgi:hypothetical protein